MQNENILYDTPSIRITTQSPVIIKQTKSFSRSPLSVLSSQTNDAALLTNSNSKLKNFVKNSFSNLHKFMNKSKTKLNGSKSNSCSPSSSASMSCSSDEASSPEMICVPQKLALKYPRTTNNNNYNNSSRRPIMGITALMLNNYKQNSTNSMISSGFTTTFPNVYLLGVPIVFNNTINTKVEVKKKTSTTNIVKTTTTTTTRKTRSSSRRHVDTNNNNTLDENNNNGYKLEIYGNQNVNESIRI